MSHRVQDDYREIFENSPGLSRSGTAVIQWRFSNHDRKVENQCASISLVQCALSIGYDRASRLLEMAELAGIVSPEKKHTFTREVLIADTHELMHRLLDIKMELYKDVESKLFI